MSLEQPWPRLQLDIAPHCVVYSGASCGAAFLLAMLQAGPHRHLPAPSLTVSSITRLPVVCVSGSCDWAWTCTRAWR